MSPFNLRQSQDAEPGVLFSGAIPSTAPMTVLTCPTGSAIEVRSWTLCATSGALSDGYLVHCAVSKSGQSGHQIFAAWVSPRQGSGGGLAGPTSDVVAPGSTLMLGPGDSLTITVDAPLPPGLPYAVAYAGTIDVVITGVTYS